MPELLLRTGSADVTPSRPGQLAGFAARDGALSTGTHDALLAELLVVDDGVTRTGWLTLDASGAVTHARFHGVAPGEARIPNAVENVVSAGASVDLGGGLTTSLRLRHFGAAPLIEDGSVRSRATTLLNLGGYYTRGAIRLGVDVLNLLGTRAPDISYFYASRLPGEPLDGVEDRHIHPAEPRQARVSLRYAF